MAKTSWRGGALIAPLPAVLISCKGKDREGNEKRNIITVAWTGIINTVPPKSYISVRKSRYSYDIIKNSGEFVINLPTRDMAKKVDYCGIYTGKKVDKFEKCAFTEEESRVVGAPQIAGCPLSLECKVTDVIELGSHDMILADIVSTSVDTSLLDKDGKLHLERASLMAFAHGEYFELGKKIGYFGFSAKKKHSHKKKAQGKK